MLPLGASEALIFKNIQKNYRQKIRAAEAQLNIRHDLPLTELHRLVGSSFERQGLEPPIDFSFLQNLYNTLAEQGCCKLFFATDPTTNAVHSAALMVWDRSSSYYLMSGDDPDFRASGAAVLLKWAAIQYTKNVLNLPVFDFEGSMIRGVEQGRRDFGAQQQPYFRVRREWSVLWKWGKFLRQ